MRSSRLSIILLSVMLPALARAAEPIAPEDASKHVGETATVCGLVAGAKYASQTKGAPTFLDFGKSYPNAVFTAVIFGDNRAKFGTPERLRGKHACVTGTIRLFRGKPEMELTDGKQLVEK